MNSPNNRIDAENKAGSRVLLTQHPRPSLISGHDWRSEGKIPGAYQEGRGWKIPVDAKKPADGRYKSKESLLVQIDRKKVELDARRPWRIPQTSGSYYERTA